MVNVLFVCLGNICRSPTAEGVFRALVEREGLTSEISVDSAGTGAWHVGNPPDRRAQAAARVRGVDLSSQRARQVTGGDFQRFDYIVAMDRSNHADLESMAPAAERRKVHLFLAFAPETGVREVPDPYYGGAAGFDEVLNMVEAASRGLLGHIREHHL